MSNTRKDLIRAAKKLGYRIREGGKHTSPNTIRGNLQIVIENVAE